MGFLGLNGGAVYVGQRAGQERSAESRNAQAFVQMVKGEEQAFMTAMRGFSGARGQPEIEVALTRVIALEQHLESIKKEANDAGRLGPILSTYALAVRQWKNALLLLKEPKPDTEQARKMLKLGDQLRAEAFQAFDRQYASRKSAQSG